MAALAILQGAVLVAAPSAPLIAVGVWWNSNTISHNFIHRPFFRHRAANMLFGAYLSVLLGIPQSLWRERHLAHHAGVEARLRLSRELTLQTALVLALWIALAVRAPAFLLWVYAPGYVAGLVLCAIHGHYEHARGTTTSHYGAVYNVICFNDGYHVEHHLKPGLDWTRLPQQRSPAARSSRWPAPLRWLEGLSPLSLGLEALERLVLQSPALQAFVLRRHAAALRPLTAELPAASSVAVVGGGLFPRTALILKALMPAATLTIVEANEANLDVARAWLGGQEMTFVHARYTGDERDRYDVVVVPLAYDGDRESLYADPPAPSVIVHDWIWRKKGLSRVVSIALAKRVNLIRR